MDCSALMEDDCMLLVLPDTMDATVGNLGYPSADVNVLSLVTVGLFSMPMTFISSF